MRVMDDVTPEENSPVERQTVDEMSQPGKMPDDAQANVESALPEMNGASERELSPGPETDSIVPTDSTESQAVELSMSDAAEVGSSEVKADNGATIGCEGAVVTMSESVNCADQNGASGEESSSDAPSVTVVDESRKLESIEAKDSSGTMPDTAEIVAESTVTTECDTSEASKTSEQTVNVIEKSLDVSSNLVVKDVQGCDSAATVSEDDVQVKHSESNIANSGVKNSGESTTENPSSSTASQKIPEDTMQTIENQESETPPDTRNAKCNTDNISASELESKNLARDSPTHSNSTFSNAQNNAARCAPSSLSIRSPTGSISSSKENSRQASRDPTPLASPSRTSAAVVSANQRSDAQNAEMLEAIQGNIQSVISQSLALISGGDASANAEVSSAESSPAKHVASCETGKSPSSLSNNGTETSLHSTTGNSIQKTKSTVDSRHCPNKEQTQALPTSDLDDSDQLLSELDAELTETRNESGTTPETVSIEGPNGVRQKVVLSDFAEFRQMQSINAILLKQHEDLKSEISRLKLANQQQGNRLSIVQSERDDFRHKLDQLSGSNQTESIYIAQIKALETTIAKQEQDLKQTQEKLETHDSAAKRAVSNLQTELKGQVDKVRKVYEECRREKESMTMKYAQAEQKNLELAQRQAKQDQAMKDLVKERETLIMRFKSLKGEKLKLQEIFESRAAEVGGLRREIERQKEALQAADMKVKWHQNKLKEEGEQHKETRMKIEDYQRRVKEAKEETEQIRRDCQAMVRTYQESDDIKSNSLGKELQEKEQKLQQHMQEKSDQIEAHETVKKELDMIKRKHKDTIEELKTMKDRVTCLEAERITQEHTLDRFRETLQCQKRDNKELQDRLARLENVDQKLQMTKEQVKVLEERLRDTEQANRDLTIDMEGCAKRESEHLQFSQKVSDKNAQLQSENNALNTKLIGVTAEQERLQAVSTELEKTVKSLEKAFSDEKTSMEEKVSTLSHALQTKSKAVEELSRQVEEEKDEIRTLKRKHTANVKDLTRQLHLARKKLESLDQPRPGGDSMSVGSRTSSNGSLDTVGTSQCGIARAPSQEHAPQEEVSPTVEVIEVDKQMLVEKIVRLQRAHARKNEKMEFLEDHINHLVSEIQRKTKIIQNYIMREETGALAPEAMDRNKAQLAKKGGIMASLYHSHAQDGAMNLDLSLEINHKLQSVLEDTLLKNITLKENLETLGQEIARISQENRRLQLHNQSQNATAAS